MSVAIKMRRDYGLHLSEWETSSAGQSPSIESTLNTEL
jgi:hypothetical protein